MNKRLRLALITFLGAVIIAGAGYFLWPSLPVGFSAPSTPQQVVEKYYRWYLDYIGDPAADDVRNPVVDRAYRNSKLLSTSFIAHIDAMLEDSEFIPADPFLCAQDIPASFTVQGVFQHDTIARVVVRTDFPGHVFTVDVQEMNRRWKISNVSCGGSPAGTAYAFYSWYLGYMGDRAQGEFKNPLADRAYRDSQFLSTGFITSVDEMLSSETPGGFDPFLLAQDIPTHFSVDPGLTDDSAVVHLQFGESTVRHLNVRFIRENGLLLISSIEEDIR